MPASDLVVVVIADLPSPPPHEHDSSVDGLQQELSGLPQLHSQLSISFPLRAAEIIAQAHPTPLCTSIA